MSINNPVTNKKVAIIHHSLWKYRGAERVLFQFCELFPDAELFCLFGDESSFPDAISNRKIHYSFINRFPLIRKYYKLTLPLWTVAVENFKLAEYDLVISTSSSVCDGVIIGIDTKHLSYIYSPMRFLWDQRFIYDRTSGLVKRWLQKPLLTWLRVWEMSAIQRPDRVVVISKFIGERLMKYLNRSADSVVYPPAELELPDGTPREEFLLAISPFEENKGAEYIFRAASVLGFQLKVTGNGKYMKRMRKEYGGFANIEFLGWVSEDDKWNLYRKAKGLLFLGIEDFGLVPVEAISVGCPVIAYAEGGAKETVIDSVNGFLVSGRETSDLKIALELLEATKLDPTIMHDSVKQFSVKEFREKILSEIKALD